MTAPAHPGGVPRLLVPAWNYVQVTSIVTSVVFRNYY